MEKVDKERGWSVFRVFPAFFGEIPHVVLHILYIFAAWKSGYNANVNDNANINDNHNGNDNVNHNNNDNENKDENE